MRKASSPTNPCTQSRTASNASPVAWNVDAGDPAASDSWLTLSSTSRLSVPIRTNTPSTTLPATEPRARARLRLRMTGYRPIAMPAPVAAQTNSMSAVRTTRLSLVATVAR